MIITRKQKFIYSIKSFIWGMCVAALLLFIAFAVGFAVHYTIAALWAGWRFYV